MTKSESVVLENQINYYQKEFCASLTEAKRQCDIAIGFANKIMKIEEKLCQMKK